MMTFPWVVEPGALPGFVIRATVVLATGLVLAWLVRRRSAQIRHRLWTVTLLVLLLLPPLTLWAPQLRLPLLPAAADARADTQVGRVAVPPDPAAPALPIFPAATASGVFRPQAPVTASSAEPHDERSATQPAGGLALPHPMVLWAIGCLAGLASLAAGHLRFHRLVRGARPLRDRLWQRELETAGQRLGLRRDVRLLVSEAAGTPMTGGFRSPVVIVPATASTWDSQRRQVVLTHELVHVLHRDALRQLMGGVVLALYWFHPLSWLACRLAATSREEACDERVLELGSRPSEYARHLMSLAATTGAERLPVAALSMARPSPSRLEKRIMAILRPRRPRPSALATAALAAATAALGVAVAVTHPVHRTSADVLVMSADRPVGVRDQPVGVQDQPVGVRDQPAVSQDPPGVHAVDREAGATVPQAATPSETPGSGSPSDPGGPAGDSGEASARAGAARSVLPRPDVPDADCDSLPPGAGSVFEGSATASGPDSSPRDVVRVVMETVDGVRLCMRIRTDAVLEAGELRSLAPDDWILLESQGDRLHRLIIRTGSGGFEYEWSVGGEDRAFDEQAKEWRDGMLAVLGGQLEIGRIQREVSDLQEQITHHRGVVSGLQGQVAHDRDVVASLQGQVSYYQAVVSGLLDQISYHQSVVAGMRDDITYHRSVVSGMRDEISMHRARVAALQDVKSSYQAQITAIIPRLKTADAGTRKTIEASISGWEERIREIEEQIGAYGLGGKVAKINSEIRDYSLDAKVRNLEQQISSYELNAGLQKIEADIEEQSGRLDDATRRAEEALKAREARIGEVEREVDAYYLDGKVARLEQQIRDLGADEAVARIEQSIEEARRMLLDLIRRF